MPRISVIIPTWNSDKYIGRLLRCIELQEFDGTEVIVVDNLSIDRTKEIVESYQSSLNIVWISEKDKGQGDAVTKGLTVASGTICHWHAADDLILPGSFQRVWKIIESDPKIDLVFSDGLAYRDGAGRLASSWPTVGLTKLVILRTFGRFQSDTVYWKTALNSSCLPLRDDIPLMVDEEFFVRLVQAANKISRAPRPLGVFVIRPGQISETEDKSSVMRLRKEFRLQFVSSHKRDLTAARAYLERSWFKVVNIILSVVRYGLRKLGQDYYWKEFSFIKSVLSET